MMWSCLCCLAMAFSPRLTFWALWFSMSRCLLHLGKGSLPLEGFQRWGSHLQGFGNKNYYNTGHSRELKIPMDKKNLNEIGFLTQVAFKQSCKLQVLYRNISLCVKNYYLLDMTFKCRIWHSLQSSMFPFWMSNCIYLSKSGQSVYCVACPL